MRECLSHVDDYESEIFSLFLIQSSKDLRGIWCFHPREKQQIKISRWWALRVVVVRRNCNFRIMSVLYSWERKIKIQLGSKICRSSWNYLQGSQISNARTVFLCYFFRSLIKKLLWLLSARSIQIKITWNYLYFGSHAEVYCTIMFNNSKLISEKLLERSQAERLKG